MGLDCFFSSSSCPPNLLLHTSVEEKMPLKNAAHRYLFSMIYEFRVQIKNGKETHVANRKWTKGYMVGNGKWNTLTPSLAKSLPSSNRGHIPPDPQSNCHIIKNIIIKLKNNTKKWPLQYHLTKKHALKRSEKKNKFV